MKKVLKGLALLLALLAAVLLIGGLLLKPNYRVERSLLMQAPPERIYAELDSAAGWQRWGVWYRRDPQMQQQVGGPARGVGAHWQWTSASQGNGRIELTAAEPGRRVAYELRIDDFDPSRGELRLVPEGQATRVIWLMQGEVGGNPLKRWFALAMDPLVGPDFEAGLAQLQQIVETR